MLAAGTSAALLVAACGSTNKTATSSNSSSSNSSSSSGSSSSGGAPSGSPVVFHAVLSETGAYSFLGSREAKALQGLAKAVNSSGGIDGHPMKLDIKDNQSNPSTSVAIASKWIGSGVQFLLNGSAVATNKAVDALATSNGPFIYDLSPGVHPKAGSMIFSAGQSTTADAEGYLTYLKSQGLTRVAIINSTDASGADGYAQFTHQLSSNSAFSSFHVLDHETFSPTAASVTTQMAKIKATNPQAIIAWTTGTPLGLVLTAMKSLNMDSIPTVTSDSNASYAELTHFASLVPQHLYFPTAALYLPPADLTGPVATAVSNFDKAVTAEGGHGGDTWGLSYDPALLIIGALKHLGVNAKAPQILKYMENLHKVPGIYGEYSTSYSDHRGVHVQDVYVSEWTGSTFKPVSGPGGAPPAPSPSSNG